MKVLEIRNFLPRQSGSIFQATAHALHLTGFLRGVTTTSHYYPYRKEVAETIGSEVEWCRFGNDSQSF